MAAEASWRDPSGLSLFVDPGEDTGWCLARGPLLLGADTQKLWLFGDDVWETLAVQNGLRVNGAAPLLDPEAPWWREEAGDIEEHLQLPIVRIVCEDWRIYPEKAKALIWDPCRTARLIGSLTQASRFFGLDFHTQGAAIKPEAQRGGCEEFYYRPLHENRHQNDAIQHFVYFTMFGPEGSGNTPQNLSKAEREGAVYE